jgi:hypothetical protein
MPPLRNYLPLREPPSPLFLSHASRALRAGLACLGAIAVFDLANVPALGWTLGSPILYIGVTVASAYAGAFPSFGFGLLMLRAQQPRIVILSVLAYCVTLAYTSTPVSPVAYRVSAPFVVFGVAFAQMLVFQSLGFPMLVFVLTFAGPLMDPGSSPIVAFKSLLATLIAGCIAMFFLALPLPYTSPGSAKPLPLSASLQFHRALASLEHCTSLMVTSLVDCMFAPSLERDVVTVEVLGERRRKLLGRLRSLAPGASAEEDALLGCGATSRSNRFEQLGRLQVSGGARAKRAN